MNNCNKNKNLEQNNGGKCIIGNTALYSRNRNKQSELSMIQEIEQENDDWDSGSDNSADKSFGK